MTNQNTYADIETHEDGHMAVNVKCYNWPNLDCDEQTAEMIWEQLAEQFWSDARDIARDHGYDYVFSEGRSDGWCVPFRQSAARRANLYSSPGQGGQWGYPQYPDIESIGERSRFRGFQRAINRWMATIPDMARDALAFELEQRAELEVSQ